MQWSPSLIPPAPDLLRTEGPGKTFPEDVSVQLLEEGDAPLVPGPCPRPPVHHHHAPGEGPGQLHTIVTRDMSDEDMTGHLAGREEDLLTHSG